MIYLFALSGLSCGKCVARLKTQLLLQPQLTILYLDKSYLKVSSAAKSRSIIQLIETTGFHATLATQPDLCLNLGKVNCNHCLAKITETLNTLPSVVAFELEQTQAKLYGKQLEQPQIITAIETLGFSATPQQQPTAEAELDEVMPPAKQQNTPATSNHSATPWLRLRVEAMSCASCIAKIEKKLNSLAQVESVSANLAQHLVLVQSTASIETLQQALQSIGYPSVAMSNSADNTQQTQQQELKLYQRFRNGAIIALLASFLMMFWAMQGHNDQLTSLNQPIWLVLGALTGCLMILTGRHFFISSWRNLLHGQTTMDSLVALSSGTAWLYSAAITLFPLFFPSTARHLYYESALMIIGFINLGHAIEIKGKQRSSSALQQLLQLTPPTARVITAQQEQLIPLEQVKCGMTLRVNTGERVAVDGTIIAGEGWLNESMLTGEPLAQYKQPNDTLFAGTLLENGSLLFQAESVGNATKLAQIVQIVEQAQSSKPKLAKLVDKIAAIFVPAVLLIALCSALLWFFIGPTPQLNYALIIFTTVLIIACPCALGLATPMSIIASVARAAQLGILVKDAQALAQAATVDTIVFDKTGTLTQGKPAVSLVEHLSSTWEQATILNMVQQLEKTTHHPLAQAILDYAARQPDSLRSSGIVSQIMTHKGFGLSGEWEGKALLLGNERLMQQHKISTSSLSPQLMTARQQGATLVFFAIDAVLVAIFAITDTIRAEAAAAVARLQRHGYQLVILTGDHQITAQHLADSLQIQRVIANLLPEDKAQAIQQLQQAGCKVAMVGDGINDAPALAQAEVGIAMGQGSHIAIETADLVLMSDQLDRVNDALALAKQATKNIKQNLLGAFIYNLICIPIAAGLLYPIWGVLLNPMFGSFAMALSSVTVIANANRLLGFKAKP